MSAHHRKLERMYVGAPVNRAFDPDIHVGDGEAEVSFDVGPEHHHAADAVHGHVLFKALDDAAFFAANSVVEDVFVLTVGFDLRFLRPFPGGRLRAVGELVHAGRRLLVADATARGPDDAVMARGTGTFMPSEVELDASMGYE